MPGTPERPYPETVLAFDFGLRRIGVAVGQDLTGSASPLGTVKNGANGPDQRTITKLIDEWQPNRLVVGMPADADGSPTALQPQVQAFVGELRRYQLPVERIDERYTSVEAAAILKNARATGSRGRVSKEMIDSAAAVLIAERYLASRTATQSRIS